MRDVIICVGTIGGPTFDRCLGTVRLLEKSSKRVGRVEVISNKSPQSAWLNEMREASKGYRWCLQVDEDMYLRKDALSVLLDLAEAATNSGTKVLNASSLLYDIFLMTKIGSLKLWSTDPLRELKFNDVLGGDRDYAKRAERLGYKNVSVNKVLGDHDSAPTPAIAFKKYFEYTQKLRKFSGEKKALEFSFFLKNKWKSDGTYLSKKAYDGSKDGLAKSIKNKTKRA